MGKRKNSLGVLIMVLLLGLSLFLIFRGQDMDQVFLALRTAKFSFLLLGLFFMALFVGLEALQTRLALLVMGFRVPFWFCYFFSLTGFYFSSITPSSSGGQPAQVFYMTRRGIPLAYGTLDMLLITVCYQLASLLYALAAWFAFPQVTETLGTGLGVLLGYGMTITLVLTGGILLFFLAPSLARKICVWFLQLGVKLHLVRDLSRSIDRLDRHLSDYKTAAGLLKKNRWLLPALLLLSLAQMTALYLVPWAVYGALGLAGCSLGQLVATQALLSLAVGTLPLPGAAGVSEAGFLAAFSPIFSPALTPSAMLLSRGISFYLPLLFTGGATLLLHLKTRPKMSPGPGRFG